MPERAAGTGAELLAPHGPQQLHLGQSVDPARAPVGVDPVQQRRTVRADLPGEPSAPFGCTFHANAAVAAGTSPAETGRSIDNPHTNGQPDKTTASLPQTQNPTSPAESPGRG